MTVRLTIDAIAHGGDGIARPDGKTTFVPGAIPGDVIDAEVVESKERFDRARLVEVIEPSPERVDAPCPHAERCGGCSWQHADYDAQLRWKQEIVAGQLRHLGRLEADVAPTLAVGDPFHYRNRMDFATTDGRLALREAASHTLVPLDVCLLLVPELEEVFHSLDGIGDVGTVTLRTSVGTGERAVIVDGDLDAVPDIEGVMIAPPGGAAIHEIVGGVTFMVAGRAFFQVNTSGAEALVAMASERAGLHPDDVFVDAYAGVGLFASTLGRSAGRVIAIEQDPVAAGCLVVNTDESVEVIDADVADGLDMVDDADVVIVDPPRAGLGAPVVERLLALAPRRIVSISCDAASFARDARGLVDGGYTMGAVQPVDMFPQTPHIETVTVFDR